MTLSLCTVVTLLVAISIRVQGQGNGSEAADTSSVEGLYNCNRGNMECVGDNSTCIEATGTCNCEDGYEWFDCSVETAKKVTDDCDCDRGVCVDTGSATECVCSESYHGPKCDKERVTAECFHDSMDISISPYGDAFDGLIYVLDNETPDCTLPDDGNGVFKKKLKYEDCGAAEVTNETNGDTVKSFILVVQYDSLFLDVYDQEFEFSCTIRKSDSNLEWETTDLESNKNQRNLQQQKVSKEVKPVTLTLRNAKTNEVITTPQSIGTPVKMCFTLNGGEVYDSFRVEQVTAHNGLTGDRAKSFDFVSGGCVHPKAGSIGKGSKKVVTDFSGDPSSEVCLKFKLIKLPYSNQLAFKNVVKICKGTGNCNATTCDPDEFMKLGRRRRSIQDFQLDEDNDDADSTFEEVDNRGIVVWIPGQKLTQEQAEDYMNDANNSSNQSGFCFQNIWVIVCIVSLLLVFSLGGALVAVLCLRRRQGKESAVLEGFENKAYNTKI